ncbi:MAG TPA: hypothetical protein VF532_03595 [Candidatus Angelobacter sp.]
MASGYAQQLEFSCGPFHSGSGGALVGLLIAACILVVCRIAHQQKIARVIVRLVAAGVVLYALLFLGFSLFSHETVLAQGEEKYFCEWDCHLAYSVVAVKAQASPGATRYSVTLRTRFDETTTAPWRPKDYPLQPSPRTVFLIDSLGHSFAPQSVSGTPLMTDLVPGQNYTTELSFDVPAAAQGLRLLVATTSGWPDRLAIGDENSYLHKKTYFAI